MNANLPKVDIWHPLQEKGVHDCTKYLPIRIQKTIEDAPSPEKTRI